MAKNSILDMNLVGAKAAAKSDAQDAPTPAETVVETPKPHAHKKPVKVDFEAPTSTIFRTNRKVLAQLKNTANNKGITLQCLFEQALAHYLKGQASIPGITDIDPIE